MGKKEKKVEKKGHFEMFVSGLPYTCTEDDLANFLAC